MKIIDWDSIPYRDTLKIIKLERECEEITWFKDKDWKRRAAKVQDKIDKLFAPYVN